MSGFAGQQQGQSGARDLNDLLAQMQQNSQPRSSATANEFDYPFAPQHISPPAKQQQQQHQQQAQQSFASQISPFQPFQPQLQPSHTYYPGVPYFGQSPHHGVSYQQPSVQSAAPTPPAVNSASLFGSGLMSPVEPALARQPSGSVGSNPLLNLLNFHQQPAASTLATPELNTPRSTAARGLSSPSLVAPALGSAPSPLGPGAAGSDLLATFMGTRAARDLRSTSASTRTPSILQESVVSSPPANTQSLLLSLLGKQTDIPQDAQASPLQAISTSRTPSQATHRDEIHQLSKALGSTSLEHAPPPNNNRETTPGPMPKTAPIFTYVNPFEQLAAAAPRQASKPATPAFQPAPVQILKRGDTADHKRKLDERSNKPSPAPYPKRRIDSNSHEPSAPPTPLPDGRTPLEALIGIGAPSSNHRDKSSVAEALEEVSDRVNDELQEAIARAEKQGSDSKVEHDLRKMLAARTEKEFEETATTAAKSLKEELDRESNKDVLEDLPTPVAEYVKDIIEDAANGSVAENWENASIEGKQTNDEAADNSSVTVYGIPLKPFHSITISGNAAPLTKFRDEIVIDIARLKKEFDQVDRVLASASNSFLVYGMPKNGGMRVIRQTDGQAVKFFEKSLDRVYSVTLSTTSLARNMSVIGVGVGGNVYWATVRDHRGDCTGEKALNSANFIFPPLPMHDSEAVGGAQKTRACKSSNHVDLFAVGRGRTIHLVTPSIILDEKLCNATTREVDMAKYLAKESLRINTGKACKDFIFSADDSIIVSLDKTGRVKFFDIRQFQQGIDDPISRSKGRAAMEITDPLLSINTAYPNEKAWPTSLLFVDKPRPYEKNIALRYLVVGHKQNHTLQLWDLGLRKIIQTINLPHSKESDAICSVVYHVGTSTLIIGHPTRNSIYFVHVSAPRYAIPAISQLDYIQSVSNDHPSFVTPTSTAVFSQIREYSFATKGDLRSLDVLQSPSNSNMDDPAVFELYVMHSKGVTCLTIKTADLGNCDKKSAIDGVQAGVVTLQKIDESYLDADSKTEGSTPLEEEVKSRTSTKEPPKEILKKPVATENSVSQVEEKSRKESEEKKASTPAPEGKNKNRRRKAAADATQATPDAQITATNLPSTPSRGEVKKSPVASSNESKSVPKGTAGVRNGELPDTAHFSRDVEQLLEKSLSDLATSLRNDRRAQAAVAEAKQETMLRLVSSTLTENIEVTLARIINESVKTAVIPAITDIAAATVAGSVSSLDAKLATQVAQVVPKELQKVLPDAIAKALHNPQLLKLMSDALARSVAFKVEESFAAILQDTVTPAFESLTLQATKNIATEVQRQASDQIGSLERRREVDNVKIQQLTELVTSLSQTVTAMAKSQTTFQERFLQQQQHQHQQQALIEPQSSVATKPASRAADEAPEMESLESILATIKYAMDEGKFETAVITWLQTGREQELFAQYFVHFKPSFIQHLSLLLVVSVGASISATDFYDLVQERLSWMETVVFTVANRLGTGDIVSWPL